ncbi:MAG TPA: sulfotransferase, partial [Mycobacteriales bacterium]|nr:sulfotransferase [Mycobacteriales bacterium]
MKREPTPAEGEHGPGGRGVLVLGLPRAGATWVGQTLGLARGARLVNEPDNETNRPYAVRAKLPLGRYPVLGAGERAPRAYRTLWARAFAAADAAAGPRSRLAEAMLRRAGPTERWHAFCGDPPRASARLRVVSALAAAPPPGEPAEHVVVKSAHASFAAEWIAAEFRPRVVVVLRHPFNVVASWTDLGWGGCGLDRNPRIVERYLRRWDLPALPPSCSRLTRVSWEIGLHLTVLRSMAAEHPGWVAVRHEDLCLDPAGRLRALCAGAGLQWTEEAEVHLRQSNRPARGLVTMRVAAEQPDRWRHRLTAEQVREAAGTLERFPVVAG